MIAPNLGRNTWEEGVGGESRTHNPSHPIPQSPLAMLARTPACQPAFPVSKNTKDRERGHHLAGLVCQSVCLCLLCHSVSLCLTGCFLFPLPFPAFAYYTCVSSRLLHFVTHSNVPERRLLSAHSLTHRAASRLFITRLSPSPDPLNKHNYRQGWHGLCLHSTALARRRREQQDQTRTATGTRPNTAQDER